MGIFELEFEKTIVIFEISNLEFFNIQKLLYLGVFWAGI